MSVNSRDGLSPDDIGARVSVRYRLPTGATDVIGDLDSLDADELAIRRSDGSLVVIHRDDVVAARLVGPSPMSARELEGVSGRAVPVTDESWLGKWWLRAGAGLGARGNSVRPLGDPGVAFDDALAAAAAWYGERELMPAVRAIAASRADDELGRRGWIAGGQRSLQTATVASMRRRLIGVQAEAEVELAREPSAAWLDRYRDGTVPQAAASVLAAAPEVAFATIEADGGGAAIAIGRATVEKPWVGFAAIEVEPASRRRGYSRAVMAALVSWAADRGATRAYLEVTADNEPAVALYASLGFAEHYRYAYRTPPG
ncbi:MAG TPA: GNAT family N-acetyltransferase [Acidothermaceae bacterium]|nr:GNAT family N-acetyltransferase [Acidothermaceae bacterium]